MAAAAEREKSAREASPPLGVSVLLLCAGLLVMTALVLVPSSFIRLQPRSHEAAHQAELRKYAVMSKESRDAYDKAREALLQKEKVIRDLEAKLAVAHEEKELFKESSRAKDELIRSRHVHKLANPRLGRPDSYEFQAAGKYVGEENRAGAIAFGAAGANRHEVTGEGNRNALRSYHGSRLGRRLRWR